jgi:hypothetical protein
MRTRTALSTHVQNTHSPYHLPELGKTIAYQAKRAGVAERCAAAAVHKPIEGDLALRTYDDTLRRDLALASLTTAQPHDAHTLYLR